MQLTQDPTCAELSYIPGYQAVLNSDLSTYRLFFITTPVLWLYNYSYEYSIWVSPSSVG